MATDTKQQQPQQQTPLEEQADRERRLRPRFRALIDEMMDQIRRIAREADWTPEARAKAEADLERIMSQVRREATNRR